ncbi:hypothetical protein VCHA53O466_140024 [Vibrio chagasii]|nr:hypothetical protein VCHA53O466_140024 [Vibrio chagasii]
MKFESKFGLKEIVIREAHKNGKMVHERMMEVVGIAFDVEGKVSYLCEDTKAGIRQWYSESMLVGDPLFDQEAGAYPDEPEEGETNRVTENELEATA